MRLLLDTHVALWAITQSPRLNDRARTLLTRPDVEAYVSAVTIWEIAIKRALASVGRGEMPIGAGDAFRYFEASGFNFLDVAPSHAIAVEALPPLHHDPFDRLLLAQAIVEPMRLVTHDAALAGYDAPIEVI